MERDYVGRILERYFVQGVHGTDDYNQQRLMRELDEAGLRIMPKSELTEEVTRLRHTLDTIGKLVKAHRDPLPSHR